MVRAVTYNFNIDKRSKLIRRWAIVAMFVHGAFSCSACEEDGILFDRPIAAVTSHDNRSVLVASRNQPMITVVDQKTLNTRQITGEWADLVDMVSLPGSEFLLAVTGKSQSLIVINTQTDASEAVAARLPLNALPANVAVSPDGQFACVSMTWDHSLTFVPLNVEGRPDPERVELLSLDFQPKDLLALPAQQFLVADAFGGQLAIVDASSNTIVARHVLAGHHIGGLARDAQRRKIYISHQRLSRIAQTNRDDIHWGSLMQNGLSVVGEVDLLDASKPVGRRVRFSPIGDTGNGAGDPAGITVFDDGKVAVAIAGTDQMAVFSNSGNTTAFADVGRMPTTVVAIESSRLLCVSTLDDTVAVVDLSNDMAVTHILGESRELTTPVARGEAAFYSAGLSHDGWMSCSSCHIDGHSCDLLADTLGDGHFGNPKRIPSLLNASMTGPWGWDGSKASLQQQILQTLNKTMHRDDRSRESDGTDEAVTEDIVAFLKTISFPKPTNSTDTLDTQKLVTKGRAAFHDLGCAQCHNPQHSYTSPQTYDVTVTDERGLTMFNPPSLDGLRFRKSFFHDARFQSLDQVLEVHPDQTRSEKLTEEGKENLKAFLMSLPM